MKMLHNHLLCKLVVLKVWGDNVLDRPKGIHSGSELWIQLHGAVHPQAAVRQFYNSPSTIDIDA